MRSEKMLGLRSDERMGHPDGAAFQSLIASA